MREIYRSVNRPKIVVSSRLPTRDMVRNEMVSAVVERSVRCDCILVVRQYHCDV
jgi:hypothetical protein